MKNLPFVRKLNNQLKGAPDSILTLALFLLALFAIVVALKAPPLLKAAVVAYFALP